ncbi:monothiol glutaredoxin grx5 [Vermiconidia calcicola]|uniref:Monothiol glutaredoxin grx5 n=1 Tax=Vermiconidia calcicola TaxID=1690605 RepID=A0ACC3MCQ2_9PEZI|nr:monothiol glutaredoxin grx5 [Vermiconidia calcicola]
MFARSTISAVAGQALRPRRNPLLSPRFAALQKSFLSTETRTAIDKAVGTAPVVLFMKGTPETPQCGFSRASIQILGLQGVDPQKFAAYNVLEDQELRNGSYCLISGTLINEMASYRYTNAKLGSAAKENMPPKQGTKRTVSIEGLFNHQHRQPKKAKTDAHNILAPKHGGISKSLAPKQSISAQYRNPKHSKYHPVYLSFAEAADNYRNETAAAKGSQLEPVYDELVARVDDLNVDGQPQGPGKAELDEVIAVDAALSKPLDEERMTIQNHRRNGTVETKEIKLGDTMLAFEKLLERKRSELESLLEDLSETDAEIMATKRSIVDTEKKAVKTIKDALGTELASFMQQAESIKKHTAAAIEKAQKEEKAENKEKNRKLEELIKQMI